MFVAVDPGLACTGWARFRDGRLEACGAVRLKPEGKGMVGTAARIACAVVDGGKAGLLPVVVEMPQIYERRKSKGNPNHLLPLAAIAGAVSLRSPKAVSVTPHDWKGTIPKADRIADYIIHRRNEKALDDAGCEAYRKGLVTIPASLRHNIADAVGIGLYAIRARLFGDLTRNVAKV